MLRSTSVVITTTGASPLIALSPVSRPTFAAPCRCDQVVVLLVGQRLDRRGVEALAAAGAAARGARRTRRPPSCRRRSARRPARRCRAPAPRRPRAGSRRGRSRARSRTRRAPGSALALRGPAARRGVPLGGARLARRARHTTRLVRTRRADALARSMGAAGSLGRVLGVPEHAEPPSPRAPATAAAAGARRPVEAVLFDFHGTLAQVEDPVAWVLAGRRGVRRRRWTAAARDRRSPTGWSPPAAPAARCPHRVPPHLAEVVGRARPVPARAPGRLHRPGGDRGRRRRGARRRPVRAPAACRRAGRSYADTVAALAGAAGRRGAGGGGQQHRLRHPAAVRGLGPRRPGRRVRAVVRGGPLQAGPGDLPCGVRACSASTRSGR